MRIAIGCDHRGVEAVRSLLPHLRSKGHDVMVLGECSGAICDYPDNAWLVGQALVGGAADVGILICGSGIGMCMTANKIPGVRAALVSDELTAHLSRAHNNANIICLAGDLVGTNLIHRIVDAWIGTPFEGGRHERRIRKLELIERGESPIALTAGSPAAEKPARSSATGSRAPQ
jgi:ribose 5-phosphate isomerase B